MHPSAWRKASHYSNIQNQKAYYSPCQTLKNDLVPSGFDPRIFTMVSDFFHFYASSAHEGRFSVWNRKASGFMGHFTMAQKLIHYILLHILLTATVTWKIIDAKRVTILGLLKPGFYSEWSFIDWVSFIYKLKTFKSDWMSSDFALETMRNLSRGFFRF